MATNSAFSEQYDSSSARHIISLVVPKNSRLSGFCEIRNLEALASDLGVKDIRLRPLTKGQDGHPGIDAMLIPLSDGYSVVINDTATAARQRYSLAHELGHIMLLTTESLPRRPTRSPRYLSGCPTTDMKKAEERLCDEIAAELLMPEEVFKEEIESQGRSLGNLPRWANSFRTSLTATAIRYWELLPEASYLIRWRKSLHRRGVISPAWQMRNRTPGPYVQPVVTLSASNAFRAIQESWNTLSNSRSLEDLLIRYRSGGRSYFNAATFETESIGFGSPKNRTVMSMVYLDRTCENIPRRT